MSNNSNKLAKPKTIKIALQLLWGSLAIGLINTIINWNESIAQMTQPMTMDKELFSVIVASSTFFILSWLFYMISTGRNWARITFLCLYLIGLPFSVPQLISLIEQAPLKVILAILISIFQLISLIILFSNTGNVWFKAHKRVT
jgi:hypothetical protein